MTFPTVIRPFLPQNTVVPEDDSLFIAYFTDLYKKIAYSVNQKDWIYTPMAITYTATNILNLPTFGSYIVCVSGVTTGLPCLVAALSKASNAAAGTVEELTFQAGTDSPFSGATLTITSTTTNYQIAHSVENTTGSFNIRIIGTQ